MTNYIKKIQTANSLVELRDILNEYNSHRYDENFQDVLKDFDWDFPVFSSNAPADTLDVWSYDDESVLLSNGNSDGTAWYIEHR
jgi:hypothetical protein